MVLCGYTPHAKVIRPSSWLYHSFFWRCVSILPEKTQSWLCIPDHRYSLISLLCVRGYTWLYTAYVPKRCHNLQTMVLHGYTIRTVVIRPSPWLYQSFFSRCVIILPGKARSGYVSTTVVIRLISWLCAVIRGYILHMYPKGTITFTRWLYVVIRSNLWLYAPVRGYTACCSPYASAAYHETPGVVMSPWSWLYVSYRCYAWFYVVIYCNYTSKRSQNHVVATRHMRHLHVKRGRYSLSITLWVL